jgi:hypothetical protein
VNLSSLETTLSGDDDFPELLVGLEIAVSVDDAFEGICLRDPGLECTGRKSAKDVAFESVEAGVIV